MVKRKVSEEMIQAVTAHEGNVKKTKLTCDITGSLDVTRFDLFGTSYLNVLEDLLNPIPIQDFLGAKWEKEPLHIKRNIDGYYGSLFSFEKLKEILQKNELQFESDVNVCRYINGEKELLNEDCSITPKKADDLVKNQQATLQFHQPQRFSNELWNIMEKMETYFGNLVGANVYFTPPDAQGLAPHCDDVEIFVLQLEGCKKWQIYTPMVELSRDYTQDLLQESIGDPIMEVEMQVGDLLYLPRGFIHQAKTVGDNISTHVTLSTYQSNTVGDFMRHAANQAIEYALEDDVSFRRGLPICYSSFLGTAHDLQRYIEYEDDTAEKNGHTKSPEIGHAKSPENGHAKSSENGHAKSSENGHAKSPENGKEVPNKYSLLTSNVNEANVLDFKEKIKKQFSKLIDHIDVNTASDSMCNDFIASRLPPYGYEPSTGTDITLPSPENSIKLKFKNHLRLVYCSDEDDIPAEDGDDKESDGEDSDSDSEEKEEITEKKGPSKRKGSTVEGLDTGSKETREKEDNGAKEEKESGSQDSDEDDDDDVGDLNEGPCLKILYSLCNSRSTHMMTRFSLPPQAVRFPLHFANAVKKLFTENDFVSVSDLPNLDEDEKRVLTTTLASQDLIEIKAK